MRIVVHSPFGSMSEETGVIYLLARYLRRVFPDIAQLRCSGAFSLCDRDAESSWRRTFHTCFRCMQDQRELAAWADINVRDLSSYTAPAELLDTRRWISFLPVEALSDAAYNGVMAFPFIRGSLKNRLGVDDPQAPNRRHEQMVRRMLLASVRTWLAMRRFNEQHRPDLMIVAGGDDFISHSVFAQCRSQCVPTALVRWVLGDRQRAASRVVPLRGGSAPAEDWAAAGVVV